MPNPQEVKVVTSRFETGVSVIGGLGSVASAAQSGFAIYNLIQGGGKTDTDRIIDALNGMSRRLEKGLEKLAELQRDGNELSLWDKNRLETNKWKRSIMRRAAELRSFDADTKMVEVAGEDVGVAAWCEGPSGVLAELAGILGEIRTWLEASDAGALDPVDQWDHMARAGTANRSLGLNDENALSMMYLWYESVAGLVQAASYIRNMALACIAPPPPLVPASGTSTRFSANWVA